MNSNDELIKITKVRSTTKITENEETFEVQETIVKETTVIQNTIKSKPSLEIFGVYLVNFNNSNGNEISGRHYAVLLTSPSKDDKTMLVAPITGKKPGKKYRGGFTIDCCKYQSNPTYKTAFVYMRKIREVDKGKIIKRKAYSLDQSDITKLKDSLNGLLYK